METSLHQHVIWRYIENANVSGGEPTTRNDLVDICRIMLDKLPRLRKFGLNTTGLTPQRAIPMLTDIVKLCAERDVIFSFRVSIDGVGQMHNDVRQVPHGFDKANQTIRAMQALAFHGARVGRRIRALPRPLGAAELAGVPGGENQATP